MAVKGLEAALTAFLLHHRSFVAMCLPCMLSKRKFRFVLFVTLWALDSSLPLAVHGQAVIAELVLGRVRDVALGAAPFCSAC